MHDILNTFYGNEQHSINPDIQNVVKMHMKNIKRYNFVMDITVKINLVSLNEKN